MINELNKSAKEEKGMVESAEQLFGFISELKEVNRHLFSNVYDSKEDLCEYIKKGKLRFHYVRNICLNIFKKEWDFNRLLFYVADLEHYELPDTSGIIVCDLFVKRPKEELVVFKDILANKGFVEYAKYERYVSDNKYNKVESTIMDHHISRWNRGEEFFNVLQECFDKYTDNIPEPDEAMKYLDNHMCFEYVNDAGTIEGGAVITIRGMVATEEFIFVVPRFRGKGLSNHIRDYWIKRLGNNTSKYISWVRSDNVASYSYLDNIGYKKDKAYKLTFKKGW